jgi:hypothetical protein
LKARWALPRFDGRHLCRTRITAHPNQVTILEPRNHRCKRASWEVATEGWTFLAKAFHTRNVLRQIGSADGILTKVEVVVRYEGELVSITPIVVVFSTFKALVV